MDVIKTDDGSMTVRHELLGELYHSDRGAIGEAQHVYIEAGFEWSVGRRDDLQDGGFISVFEVGFGTGLNTLLTYQKSQSLLDVAGRVDYHAIELYPIENATVAELNYTKDSVFKALHRQPWDGMQSEVSDRFLLTKYGADLVEFDFDTLAGRFDVVYFDAFAPDSQPELWTEHIMASMYDILKPDGCLVTYTSKGSVKQALRAVGFTVSRLAGAMGKRHMVRAVKSENK